MVPADLGPVFAARIDASRAQWGRPPPPGVVPEPFAPEEESVWEYPRPPRVDRAPRAEVWLGEALVAASDRAVRVLETASPPTIYLPLADVAATLVERPDRSLCEWKGIGVALDVVVAGHTVERGGWRYPDPLDDLGQGYGVLADMVSFYPARFTCSLGGRPVTPQPGRVYGGWVTHGLRGPWKGGAGTGHW